MRNMERYTSFLRCHMECSNLGEPHSPDGYDDDDDDDDDDDEDENR